MNKTHDLMVEIKRLEAELLDEIQQQQESFFGTNAQSDGCFDKATRQEHKAQASNLLTYLANAPVLNLITLPVIWFGIIPALFMDLFATLYQIICFRVYGISRVNRGDYLVVDRQNLHYLNAVEKINCLYCGYFNGVIAYVQEIAARTEQYWCPIKHARRLKAMHSRYYQFLDFGDYQAYQTQLSNLRKQLKTLDRHEVEPVSRPDQSPPPS